MIRFGVVGFGHIGKRHADIIMRQQGAKLQAVCDRLGKSTIGFDLDLPFYEDLDEMLLHEKDLDVVCICTPNGLHAEQSLKVIDANKHVIIEKPMALRKSDCEVIIHRALDAQKQVFGVMQNRFSPPAQWLKSLLVEKHLGEIYMVDVNCYWNRGDDYYQASQWKGSKKLDGGVLFTQFSHFIDILYWLFGDLDQIQGKSGNFRHQKSTEFIDSGNLNFVFKNGGLGSLSFSTAVHARNFESSMTIIAEKGTVKIGGQYMNEVAYCEVEDYEMPVLPAANPANQYGKYRGSAANHNYIIENVIDTLNGHSRITTNAMDGMKVVDIIERMHAALEGTSVK